MTLAMTTSEGTPDGEAVTPAMPALIATRGRMSVRGPKSSAMARYR